MYQIAMDACQNANFIPDIIFTSHRIDSILDMVASQNCVALLMDVHLQLPEIMSKQSSNFTFIFYLFLRTADAEEEE